MSNRIPRERRKRIAIHYLENPKGGISSTADHFDIADSTVSKIVKELLREIGHPVKEDDLYNFAMFKSDVSREELADKIREL